MALIQRPKFVGNIQRMSLLKKLFWTYYLLLIFEGALRKWILPQFAAPLLIIRDPVAILIIWEAYRKHKWPVKWSAVVGFLCATLIGLAIVQVVAGSNPWFSALYGLRSYLLPFPVAFIMAENLDAEDLRKFAVCTLWLLLPLTALEVVQYVSPADSFWNKGATHGSEQLAYVSGHVRASATFSYVTGPLSYLPIAAAFIFYGLARPGFVKRWLLWAASCALVLAIPVTGSRTAVVSIAAVVICVGIAALFGVSQFVRSLQVIIAISFVALLVSRLPIFSAASDDMLDRFTIATDYEGGSTSSSLASRLVAPSVDAIDRSVFSGDLLGRGMGYGSAVTAQLMTGQQFGLVGEGESERVFGEFGWPVGFAFMLFRIGLACSLAARAIACARERDPLALLLMPLTFSNIVLSILEQPTEQGFVVLTIAFSVVATKQERALPLTSASADPRIWAHQRRAAAALRQRGQARTEPLTLY